MSVTSILERTGSPIYEDLLNFLLYNRQLEDILVEMVDMYSAMETTYIYMIRSSKSKHDDSIDWVELSKKGSVLGRVNIPVGEILRSPNMATERNYQLEGHLRDCHIHLNIVLKLIQYSQNIIENQNKPLARFPSDEILTKQLDKYAMQ